MGLKPTINFEKFMVIEAVYHYHLYNKIHNKFKTSFDA